MSVRDIATTALEVLAVFAFAVAAAVSVWAWSPAAGLSLSGVVLMAASWVFTRGGESG